MAGRGDNNQHGSAGRGSSNQSNQAVGNKSDNQSNSNHGRGMSGGERSEPSPRSGEQDAERNQPMKNKKRKRG